MSNLFGQDLREMSIVELEELAAQISDFLINKTHFSVESVMRATMVMEVTLALHHVFDFDDTDILFDDLETSIVHRYLTGKFEDLTDFESLKGVYQSTNPGFSLGVACGIALKNSKQTIVVLDDFALNYGTTFESLLQISTYNPDLILIVLDEQNSLLRHYGSVDSMIKSVRISKTYTTLKKDVKSILSNPVGRPLLGTMTRMRDGLKERIIEPTVFAHFGLQYQGPINGVNLRECIRAFEMAKTLSGPQVFHVKTRVRRSFQASIQFPKFKTDQSIPDGYQSYLEHIDTYLSYRDDVMLFVDVLRQQDHLADFAVKYPDNYIMSNGSYISLIDIMKGYALKGTKCVLVMNASDFKFAAPHIEAQFRESDDITIILRDAGLAPYSGKKKQGVYDLVYIRAFISSIYMGKDVQEAVGLLQSFLDADSGVNILRIPYGITGHHQMLSTPAKLTWEVLNEAEIPNPKGVLFTYGPAAAQAVHKVRVNENSVWVVNCKSPLIGSNEILNTVRTLKVPVVVYDVEDVSHALFDTVNAYDASMRVRGLTIRNTELELGARDLKIRHHLNVEDALSLILDK